MRPKSEDLRSQIVRKRMEGFSAADLSQMFGVSVRSVQRYYRRFLKEGTTQPRKLGKPEGSKLDSYRSVIEGWIEQEPGLTLEQLTQRCEVEVSTKVLHTTVMRVLDKWGYSFNKNSARQRAKSP
jgi:transposase